MQDFFFLHHIIMRKLFILFFLLFYQSSQGQHFKFQIKRISPCDSIGRIDFSDYYLSDNPDSAYNSDTGTVILPKPGIYNVYFREYRDLHFPAIIIRDTGLTVFTFFEPKIILRSYGMHPRFVYEYCGELINGYAEDYYPNGNIRIRGNFLKGKAIDSLVEFYESGGIQKRKSYLPTEIFIEEFDSLSNLKKISHNSNKSYYLTDYKTVEYYPAGKVMRKETRINSILIFAEFYPSGRIKSQQKRKCLKEYYETGEIKTICKWRRKKDRSIDTYSFIITKIEFDRTGDIKEKQVYEQFGFVDHKSYYQPGKEIEKSDWIIKWIKVQAGKTVIIANNVESDDYFKSHPN